MTVMEKRTIAIPKSLDAEVDRRRRNTSRSKWIREAIQARLDAEDAGEWNAAPDDESTDDESTGGESAGGEPADA